MLTSSMQKNNDNPVNSIKYTFKEDEDKSHKKQSPDNLKLQLSFLNQKVQTLEERLVAKTRENESLFFNNKKSSNTSPNEVDLLSMKSKMNDLEQTNLLLTRENDYYRRVTSNKDNIELKTTKILDLEQSCSKLLQENMKLNELCKNSLKENDELKQKQRSYDPMKISVYNEISELNQRINVLEKQLKEYKTDNEFLAYKIKEKELDHKNEIEILENSNQKLISDNRIFMNEKVKIAEELKSWKEKNSVLSLENRDFENKLTQIKKELDQEKIKCLEIEKKLSKSLENHEENYEKKQEISKLLVELEKKNEKIKEFEILLSSNFQEKEKLRLLVEEMKIKIKDIEKGKEIKKTNILEVPKKNENIINPNNEIYDKIEKLVEKCNKLKSKNKTLIEDLKEKEDSINILRIYQEKYETLFQEAKDIEATINKKTAKHIQIIILISAENDRLHNLIHDYMNYQDNEQKNSNQSTKNLKEYNSLCLKVKDLEKQNLYLNEENKSLKLVNEEKSKEINHLMIEMSQLKKERWEMERFQQENQQFIYENTGMQQNLQMSARRPYNYY